MDEQRKKVRGLIVKTLLHDGRATLKEFSEKLSGERVLVSLDDIASVLQEMVKDHSIKIIPETKSYEMILPAGWDPTPVRGTRS